MKVDTYSCDECGSQRGEGNHWFRAQSMHAGHFEIAAWSDGLRLEMPGIPELHLCSEQCATKAMSKAIGARK